MTRDGWGTNLAPFTVPDEQLGRDLDSESAHSAWLVAHEWAERRSSWR
jgi:hypothetical protein